MIISIIETKPLLSIIGIGSQSSHFVSSCVNAVRNRPAIIININAEFLLTWSDDEKGFANAEYNLIFNELSFN